MSAAQPWVEEEPLNGTENTHIAYYYDNKMHFTFKENLIEDS